MGFSSRGCIFSPGLEPPAPLTIYAEANSRVELPCHLPPGGGTLPFLTAKWTPPGGRPDLQVAGDNGNFALELEAVSQTQAGTYICQIHLQGQLLSATVTLAVITGQPQVGKEWLSSQESQDRAGTVQLRPGILLCLCSDPC